MTPIQAAGGIVECLGQLLGAIYPHESPPPEGDTSWVRNFDAQGACDLITQEILDPFVASESLFRARETPQYIRYRLKVLLDSIRDGQVDMATPEAMGTKIESLIRDLALWARARVGPPNRPFS